MALKQRHSRCVGFDAVQGPREQTSRRALEVLSRYFDAILRPLHNSKEHIAQVHFSAQLFHTNYIFFKAVSCSK